MPEVIAVVDINRRATDVFEFATTPANWPLFWSVTLSVSGQVDRSPAVGSQWTEQVRIGLWRGVLTWHAVRTLAPTMFEMHATSQATGFVSRMIGNRKSQIKYDLTEDEGRTTFRRTLVYDESRPAFRGFDLVGRWVITRVSHQALAKLKAILENGRPTGDAR